MTEYPVNEKGQRICGALNRRGKPCGETRIKPNGRCRLHGGSSLAGAASSTYRHGRYSKVLPARMLDRLRSAAADTELLAMRDEIVVIDARLEDVLGRVDTGESGAVWRALREAFGRFTDARAKGPAGLPEMEKQLSLIERLIDGGAADYAAWEDVRGLIRDRMALVQSERRREVELRQMITVEQAMVLFQRLSDLIVTHVSKPEERRALANGLRELVTAQPRVLAEAS